VNHPKCKVKSCTPQKPTGSCRKYNEGYIAGCAAAQKDGEAFGHWKLIEGKRLGHAEGYAKATADVVAYLTRHPWSTVVDIQNGEHAKSDEVKR